jgi:hypothetical protein
MNIRLCCDREHFGTFVFLLCVFCLLISLDVITFFDCEPRLTAANALAACYCCRVSTGPAGESVALMRSKLFTCVYSGSGRMGWAAALVAGR